MERNGATSTRLLTLMMVLMLVMQLLNQGWLFVAWPAVGLATVLAFALILYGRRVLAALVAVLAGTGGGLLLVYFPPEPELSQVNWPTMQAVSVGGILAGMLFAMIFVAWSWGAFRSTQDQWKVDEFRATPQAERGRSRRAGS